MGKGVAERRGEEGRSRGDEDGLGARSRDDEDVELLLNVEKAKLMR